ncbi:MAG: transcription-repair coupling factor [Porphyromonas sp.]|nr:transcription-repair coupling factor [Porphyromonas sp.]
MQLRDLITLPKGALSSKTKLEGLQGSAHALLLANIAEHQSRPILCIAKNEEDAGYLQNDLSYLLDNRIETVAYFPSLYRRAIRFGQKDDVNEVSRTEVLELLHRGRVPQVIVTYPEALIEGVVNDEDYNNGRVTIQVGESYDRASLRRQLWDMGMEEVDYVYTPGHFAVRGSLIDIYSYSQTEPFRIDFFGDEVESIRPFDPETQLSSGQMDEVTILASFSLRQRASSSLLTRLPDDTIVYIDQFAFLEPAFQTTYTQPPVHPEDNVFSSLEELQEVLVPVDKLLEEIDSHTCIARNISVHEERWKEVAYNQSPEPLFHKNFELLTQLLRQYIDEGYRTTILCGQESQIRRLDSILSESGVTGVELILSPLHQGFIDHQQRVVFLTDHNIFERFHNYNLKNDEIRKHKTTLTLKEIQGLEYGDYVVHQNHGIATFGGLITMEQNGRLQETVRLNFRGGDSVFVSIHSLHHISRYKSRETEEPPQLSKLGSGAWDKLKERTKNKVKDIARDLIKIYAERLKVKGFAFSPDTYLQKELEASFMYEDTPDQERATEDVKADMERPTPMDRLICGDVGFGKTEIAIRAAFKAVADSKQVAVMVPTTVLAYQHYKTFAKRLEGFPCTVEYLSKSKTSKERRDILERLKNGDIDIIIGTHTLAGKSVEYKDLGLLVIDEEQKFGVATKERIRQYRIHVDTLTLSATPIPRTLQFSLMGARDLSNILTPPPNRYPIRTEHTTFDTETIGEMIQSELARDGQIFFIHNRVQNILTIKQQLERAVPGIRIGVGHGQMPAKELEEVLLGFIHHEYDLLLATTIVENGIDVPNANTIIINDAHRFGLSDLHQLRGRVGRGNRKAYCLLVTPPIELLTNNAKKRLQSIVTFASLGSGYHIAMQDLDIRGAGNLLGSEQSGFIADLGFETYKRVLEEAVQEVRDEELQEILGGDEAAEQTATIATSLLVTEIDTDVEAYFPQTYVPGDDERIALYRELDSIKREKDLQRYRARLIDRFGTPPTEAEELLNVARLRMLASSASIEKILLKQGLLKLQLLSDFSSVYYKSSMFATLLSNASRYGRGLSFNEADDKRSISIKGISSLEDAYMLLMQLLGRTE